MPRLFLAVLCIAILAVLPARAKPSFPCTGSLNPTERTICRDALLGDLDRRMVQAYGARRERSGGDAGRKLVSDQRLWLGWRNTCGTDSACLRRRYEQRIIDLTGGRGPSSGIVDLGLTATLATPPAAAPKRRLRAGRYERIYPDGRIEWEAVNGSAFGTDFPNGDGTMSLKSQSAPPSFPSLPDAYSGWGLALELRLLELVDSLLPSADQAPYRDMQNAFPYSDRILRHVQAVGFLMDE
ncbi:lysozyme inhibitor LprI family protein [Thalassococcus sp. BH17M4-6]|uniref:lysozyme inhibitor LprI family protein n=1 Tax=Thalassococcus sp. BH17M4-6 TaxID=3413148 RepID=UPI003BBB9307